MKKKEIKEEKELVKAKSEIEEVKSESLIISPRLTEKASTLSSNNVYTFNVKDEATKINLAKEIERVYKVKPIKVTIINHPRTAIFSRNKKGFKSGFKKASVTLRKGDKINLA